MHGSRLLFSVISILVIVACGVQAASLIPNGSFEELDNAGRPVGFSTWTGQGHPEFAADETVAHSGQRSFRIRGDGGARGHVGHTMSISPGTYKISVWYRVSEGVAPEAVILRLMIYHGRGGSGEDSKSEWDMSKVAPDTGASVRLSGKNLHISADQSLEPGKWYPLSAVFTIPDDAERMQINMFNWLGNGTVWFDDISLEAIAFDWTAHHDRIMQELGARELAGPSMLTTLRKQHPRLLISSSDIPRLKQLIENDPKARAWFAALKTTATNLLFQPPSEYEIPDGKRLLATSRRVLDRVRTLAFVYLMEEDTRFLERAWRELEAAANFKDWNPSHFLDTAEMTHAFALGYDWLYDAWTQEQKDILRRAIVEKGLEPGLNAYRGTAPYSSWVRVTHNWNLVCNGGLAMGALAVADEYPELAERILRYGIQSAPAAVVQFAPDGAWDEGVGYWHYSIRYLIPYIAALESALGDSFGLADIEGLEFAGMFPVYLTSPAGITFNFADGGTGVINSPEMYWMSERFKQPAYAWWQDEISGGRASVLALLWYSLAPYDGFSSDDIALDKHFRRAEVATMRSAWEDKEALFVGWKAGDLRANHGHLDMGSFVFDALGVRWAVDLGADDYNMPGYFSAQGWTYYRKRAEGHNTLVLNPSADPDQEPTAVGEIIFQKAGDGEVVSIADLTAAYHRHARSVKRGIAMFDERSQILVQDEIAAAGPAEVWWFMHTRADIQIDGDGSQAILSQDGKRLAVRILAPEGATFTAMPAAPLPSSPNPPIQAVNHGVQKLAIHLENVTETLIAVQLVPLRDNEVASLAPEIKPLRVWQETLEKDGRLWPALERITLEVNWPVRPGHALSGLVPIDISLGVPASVKTDAVNVLIDDEVFFSGSALPDELVIDTLRLSDGLHRLTIEAKVDGIGVVHASSFRVGNWWNITDRMEPPLETGWFGTVIRSQTSSESDGWAYTTGTSRTQLGGVDRRIRRLDTEEYMVWETPNLRRVRILLQAPKAEVTPAVRLSVSKDGQAWTDLAFEVEELIE